MILIADSGSSKTDWVLCARGSEEILRFSTAGFNPMVQSPDFIKGEMGAAKDLLSFASAVSELYFFGAGCSSPERCNTVQQIMQGFFPHANISINHDMNGAVIATCGHEAGFACILGTGSNTVLYNGEQIVETESFYGIGYILGDEGSGAYMGKILLRDFLYKTLPEAIDHHLRNAHGLDKNSILKRVYQTPNANTFLAGFARDLTLFRKDAYVQKLLAQSFDAFFQLNIQGFENFAQYPVHFVGSIAFNFKEELEQAAIRNGCTMGKIIRQPIDGMVTYYLGLK